jgi:hypothetical protein
LAEAPISPCTPEVEVEVEEEIEEEVKEKRESSTLALIYFKNIL